MPLPSDTFHHKLIVCPCDMGDDADYVMMMMTTRKDCGSATAGAGGRVAATAAGTVSKSTVATAEGRRQELRDVGSAKLQDPSAKG